MISMYCQESGRFGRGTVLPVGSVQHRQVNKLFPFQGVKLRSEHVRNALFRLFNQRSTPEKSDLQLCTG